MHVPLDADFPCLALQSKQARRANEPSLLVCHDLDGNYHSDALPQGDGNSDYYRLTDWANIDVFVYFSHALVTIPPVGWISAAHQNNTPVSDLIHGCSLGASQATVALAGKGCQFS